MIIGLITGVVIAIFRGARAPRRRQAHRSGHQSSSPAWRPSTLSARSWSLSPTRARSPACLPASSRARSTPLPSSAARWARDHEARHHQGRRPRRLLNEAGLGSAPIAHAATSEKNPVRQGLYGIFEVFMDTIVICTLTSLVVLCSGAATGNYGNNDLAGVPTAVAGFASVFGDKLGSLILAVGLLLSPPPPSSAGRSAAPAARRFLFGSKIIPPLSGSLLPRRHRRLGRQPQAGVGHLRHPQRPHGDPEPHRHPAAQPRGHQADEGALQRREGRQARIKLNIRSPAAGRTMRSSRPRFPGEKRGENAEYFRRFPFTIEKSRGMISKRVKAREDIPRT